MPRRSTYPSRLRAFEVKEIIAVGRRDAIGDCPNGSYDTYLPSRQLDQRVGQADVVFLCCSQSAENLGLVNEDFIARLKRGCLLVNIARGGLLDYPAVEAALLDGRLGGLGMDVYRNEPFTFEDSIFRLPNVVATPHVAGVTEVSYRTQARILCDNILRVRDGLPPLGCVH